MKMLTTLAAAALISGIAVANAQTTAPSQLTSTGSSAWCLHDKTSNSMNCKFASTQDCQKEAKAQGSCVQNPKMGSTTGAGPDKK